MEYLDTPNFMNPDPGLENIQALMEALGNPQDQLKFVHIAGTNGKGSTAAFLERILRESGYRTGMYTSPYLLHFSEKIQVDGVEISENEILSLCERLQKAEKRVQEEKGLYPTVFERVTALALLYFYEKQCDIVVLETGLGGRLDATNVVKNTEVAVITAIGLDHTDILGDTREKIAAEKAGICKPGCEVVLYDQEKEVMEVLISAAKALDCPVHIAPVFEGKMEDMTEKGQVFSFGEHHCLKTGMLGLYQMRNAITAVTAAQALRKRGWKVPEDKIRTGLEKARWLGRLEVRKEHPLFLVDAAHNPQGVSVLAESLRQLIPNQKKIFVLGVLADKDYPQMLDLIEPQAERFYVVTPHSTRALAGEKLAELLQGRGFSAEVFPSVPEAVRAAQKAAKEENRVTCAFGSLYYIGEVIDCLEKEGDGCDDQQP
ncbi:bifunctional folylpolyglutamate synthase/dihydrofolate synthase [Anaerotignum lactatifermentans]|nr:bifunctional folylpolyglutamate synthase/dihydrofolate synthase [Anaerotignum lactatifermentans]